MLLLYLLAWNYHISYRLRFFFRRLVVVVDDCYAYTGPTAPYLVSARGSKGGASAVTRTSPGNQSFKNIFLLIFSFEWP
jgi:hypothetical protein